MIKIMLADDHQIVREGVRSHLEKIDNYKVVAEAANGHEVLQILKTVKPDLIIMDIHMQPMDGISCTKEVLNTYPEIKVLALTMHNENQYIKQMLTAGAVGYLLKNCAQDELVNAVDKIITQGTYYSPQVTKIILNKMTNIKEKPTQTLHIPLTDREIEVLHLILKEYSNKEISQALFIGLRTVDAHKRNLLEKTGSKNIAGLVLYAINHQIFDDL